MEALNNLKFEKRHDGPPIDEASTTEAEDSAMEQEPDSEEIEAMEREIEGVYIEEEMLVFADFESYLTSEELADPNVRIKVIGIDSENPVIQINDDIYRGSYDFAMGTNVFLEEDEQAKSKIDPLYSQNPPKLYRYSGQSNKVLNMKRIFATPKADVGSTVKTEPGADAPEEAKSMDERYLVMRSYEEALNLHLPFGCYPPRFIDPEQNCETVVHRKAAALTRVESEADGDSKRNDPDYKPGMDT